MHHEKPEFESQPDPVLNIVIVQKCVKKPNKKSQKKKKFNSAGFFQADTFKTELFMKRQKEVRNIVTISVAEPEQNFWSVGVQSWCRLLRLLQLHLLGKKK